MTLLPSQRLTLLLATGAPRYQHVGRVLLFQESEDRAHWNQIQEIDGSQVSVAPGSSAGQGLVGRQSRSLLSASTHPLTGLPRSSSSPYRLALTSVVSCVALTWTKMGRQSCC